MIALFLACSSEPSEETPAIVEDAAPLAVSTTDWPSHYLVERIGGDDVVATCILPAGEDPPSWQPSGDVVAALSEAQLIVTNGADFAAWMKTASLPPSKVVETAAAVKLITIDSGTHSHGKEGEHSHDGIDPHTWSDPRAYSIQAGAVRAALTVRDPDNADAYAARTDALVLELQTLDAQLEAATADLAEVELAANHPAFNYLARRYGLSIRSFDLGPDGSGDLQGAEEWAAGHDDPVMLWEESPEISLDGVRFIVLDPLESGAPYDYITQAKANVAVLDGVL